MSVSADVHRALLARGATVAVAESLTAGLLAAALTDTPGSSATFRGGLVVYATDLKASLAGVPVGLLDREGPVSRPVAAALATGVAHRLTADFGLSTTGVAGPSPQGDARVGLVYVGLYGGPGASASAGPPAGAEVTRLQLSGDREAIRRQTVQAAMRILARVLHAESSR